jgi:uncharacterized protein (TIGR03437 family)
VPVQPYSPGIFEYTNSDGNRQAVGIRSDGSYISPANVPRPGEIIRIFATGLGQTTPATGTNRAGIEDQPVAASVIAGVNNQGVLVLSAEALPGTVGVYVVALEIPAAAATGPAVPVRLGVASGGSTILSNSPSIPIR